MICKWSEQMKVTRKLAERKKDAKAKAVREKLREGKNEEGRAANEDK
jgi:hypothetical protein